MIKRCLQCTKKVYVKPSKAKEKNFCSHECYWANKAKPVVVKCLYCEMEIIRKPMVVFKQGKNHFCNIECRSLYRTGGNHPSLISVKKKCLVCKEEMPHYLALKKTGKYCSRKCRAKDISGEKSRFWKGDKWGYQNGWGGIAKKLKKKRNNTCEVCFAKEIGKRLHVHHIDWGKDNHSEKNLIVVCALCHRRTHSGKKSAKLFRRVENGGILRL